MPQSLVDSLAPTPVHVSVLVRWRRGAFLLVTLAVLFLLSGALGCDRNIEPYQEGEEPREPDLARIFPAPAPGEGPGAAGGGQTAAPTGSAASTRGNTGTPDRTALPPSRAAGSEVASAPAAPIEGVIELAPELALSRPGGGVLFVIARPQGARGGPPLAVLRIPSPDFPLDFSIGPDNVMIPSMQFGGAISLSARLDADGNAMTRGAGDISSATLEPLSPGMTGVRLLLSEPGA